MTRRYRIDTARVTAVNKPGDVPTGSTWTFMTHHAQVLLCIARDPSIRLREMAASVGITERSAQSIVTELVEDGYLLRSRVGRRNQYRIQFDIYSSTTSGAEAILVQLRAALAGNGYEVLAQDFSEFEPDSERISVDWEFWLSR